MGAGLKKDLRVSRVGPGGSLNAFFFINKNPFPNCTSFFQSIRLSRCI
uniref:Uncharacterized protein n=1 Tax=Musa acuminata subsp. malaccensis TaxID=214687 RepID=A0A804KLM8_MUSAM